MGVKYCDRFGCEEIMCDICVNRSHYICDECAAEFRKLIGSEALSVSEMTARFVAFMETEKQWKGTFRTVTVEAFLGMEETQ